MSGSHSFVESKLSEECKAIEAAASLVAEEAQASSISKGKMRSRDVKNIEKESEINILDSKDILEARVNLLTSTVECLTSEMETLKTQTQLLKSEVETMKTEFQSIDTDEQ